MSENRRILICGNGNVTEVNNKYYLHREIARFLTELQQQCKHVTYATIGINASEEKVKNLADTPLDSSINLQVFMSWGKLNFCQKIFCIPGLLLRIFTLVKTHDLIYCYYPGTLSGLFIKICNLLHRPYVLYVRGELKDSCKTIRDLKQAHFILATGCSIVKNILPDYPNCHEAVPMSNVFRVTSAVAPRCYPARPLRGLFVGRVEKAKGVEELLAAVEILISRHAEIEFNLVGAYTKEFGDKLKSSHLDKYVRLSGLVTTDEELQTVYRNADFFCLPTHSEGFPRVLYEAMSYALPCITTLVGGIPSRMNDGKNCLAIEVCSPLTIADQIERLIQDRKLYEKLSEASVTTFRYWQGYFAGDSHAKQLIRLYDSCNR